MLLLFAKNRLLVLRIWALVTKKSRWKVAISGSVA